MHDFIFPNKYWVLYKLGPQNYSAYRDDGECRFYFCRDALEQDFGPVTFPDERKKEGIHHDENTST